MTVILNHINEWLIYINRLKDYIVWEENTIENYLIARANMGYPCNQEKLKELVKEYIENNKLVTKTTSLTKVGIIHSWRDI